MLYPFHRVFSFFRTHSTKDIKAFFNSFPSSVKIFFSFLFYFLARLTFIPDLFKSSFSIGCQLKYRHELLASKLITIGTIFQTLLLPALSYFTHIAMEEKSSAF